MRIGRLRHRVTIEQKSVTRSAIGEEVVSWVAFATVWAEVAPLRGREFFAAQQTQSSVDYKVTMRYLAGVTREMRIVWDGLPLDIVSVIDVEGRRAVLELMCVSGVRNAR